jgi:hypothetical protein
MAQLWMKDADATWVPQALGIDTFIRAEAATITTDCHDHGQYDAIITQPHRGVIPAHPAHWILLFSNRAEVQVNGTPLRSGIRILRDHDALHLKGAGPLFFSTERLAEIQPFPDAERPIHCPRCKLPIAAKQPAVQCPQCGNWHHQSGDRPCWHYGEHCALCPQPTALDAGYRWTPEML